jgi:hypothetical protein
MAKANQFRDGSELMVAEAFNPPKTRSSKGVEYLGFRTLTGHCLSPESKVKGFSLLTKPLSELSCGLVQHGS